MTFLKGQIQGQIDMRKPIEAIMLFGITLVLGCLSLPHAAAQNAPGIEVGIDYNYVRTNGPPGGCGCFSMNGGDGWIAFKFAHSLAAVGQVAVQHASNIGVSADLTFTSYLFGPRYSRAVTKRIVPFAQVLFGGTHADGSLAPGSAGVMGSPNSFAMTAGGGLDVGVSRRLAIRPAEVEYFLTRFANGVNDHQNNFRFSSGVVFRF
jgi:outer membrane immunogenic protein